VLALFLLLFTSLLTTVIEPIVISFSAPEGLVFRFPPSTSLLPFPCTCCSVALGDRALLALQALVDSLRARGLLVLALGGRSLLALQAIVDNFAAGVDGQIDSLCRTWSLIRMRSCSCRLRSDSRFFFCWAACPFDDCLRFFGIVFSIMSSTVGEHCSGRSSLDFGCCVAGRHFFAGVIATG
jgi:hypothetical protein